MERTATSLKKRGQMSLFLVVIVVLASMMVGCRSENDSNHESLAEEQFENGFKSTDPLVSISAIELLRQLACKGAGGKGGEGVSTTKFNKEKILEELKKRLASASDWEKLQILQTLISCRAEGINLTVIDQFREEKSPAISQQIVEIVAMHANLPLQREIGARAMRSNDRGTRLIAYNLLQEPYFASQIKLPKEQRRDGLVDRLSGLMDAKDPLLLAKNLYYLNDLGETQYADKFIERVENVDLPEKQRLQALSVLAMSGTLAGTYLFEKIIRQNRLDIDQRRASTDSPEANRAAVRWAKLGEIATGGRPESEIKDLIDFENNIQLEEGIEVLLSNGSPEALELITEMMSRVPLAVKRDIVTSVFRGNPWSVEQLAKVMNLATPTDRMLLVKYLNQQGMEMWGEVFKLALMSADSDTQRELLHYLRHTMISPAKVLKVATLKPQLQELLQGGKMSPEVRKEVESMLKLIDRTEMKKFPNLKEFEGLSLEDQFQTAVVGAQLKQLDPEIIKVLKTSDNSFLRLISLLGD